MEVLKDQYIKEFLETVPLYTWKEFKKPKGNRSSLWVNEIDAFCETCKQIRPFHDMRPRGSGSGMEVKALSTGISSFEFSCVSCRKQQHKYLVQQIVSGDTIKFQKYGELPRRNIERDRSLQKFFKDDSDSYEKAAVCLSYGYGIAAFSYFRRIIENNIVNLIDMLREDIENSDKDIARKDALGKLKRETPMSDKITIANEALPDYLKLDGMNPLGGLYQILSEGVHNLSDQECLQRANTVKECLKYLISELAARKKNRERFKESVGAIDKWLTR